MKVNMYSYCHNGNIGWDEILKENVRQFFNLVLDTRAMIKLYYWYYAFQMIKTRSYVRINFRLL